MSSANSMSPRRQHPQPEERQDGEAARREIKEHACGKYAPPTRGRLPEPASYGLHPCRQPAEEPPEPPLRIGGK